MPALSFKLFIPYYAKNYAGIIDASLMLETDVLTAERASKTTSGAS